MSAVALRDLIDGHAHSQFSWDASDGSMDASCRRACEHGLGGIAFTEHADLTDWKLPPGVPVDPDWEPYLHDQVLHLPSLDVEGYLAELNECRQRHPDLVILSGVEISEPHWHDHKVAELIADDRLDRVISSVHAGPVDGGACEVFALFALRPAADVIREYLTEVRRMIETFEVRVLGHIDYAARYWPDEASTYDVADFEDGHRAALAALADRQGALEINTRRPLDVQVLHWWIDEGGQFVTFGSDSHAPDTVAAGLNTAAQIAGSLGFAPKSSLREPWSRPWR